MARQLRPRKTRLSYASLAGSNQTEDSYETGAQAGSASGMCFNDGSSGSEFAPDTDKNVVEQMQRDPEDDDDFVQDENIEEKNDLEEDNEPPMNLISDADIGSIRVTQSTSTISKGKGKAVPKKGNGHPSLGSSFARSRRQMYTLPTPSVHHRHRAVPLYRREGRVERLKQPAQLFRAPSITMTNSVDQNRVMERLNKAWGFNAGPGPLWEMVEDRSWFKESTIVGKGGDTEAERRPLVHRDIRVKSGQQVLTKENAAPYLPTDITTTEEGNLKPPPPVTCYFGPFDEQTLIQVEMLKACTLSEFVPGSSAHVFNPGAPAWGVDWCPIHASDRRDRGFEQYLAVAPFPSSSHSPEIGVKVFRPSYACIQIWSLSQEANTEDGEASETNRGKSSRKNGIMACKMVLCHESGPAHDLKWCPLPSHDPHSNATRPRKLGLIAGTFEDGSLSIYVVPQPEDIQPDTYELSSTVYCKLSEPLVRIELEETSCWSLDWANSEVIAIGTTTGVIAVYNVGSALNASASADATTITDLLPTHYITVHQSAICALAWIKAPPSSGSGNPMLEEDPTVIASGGYDGMECLTDIREGHGSVMNRTRDVITTMSYSTYGGGPVTIDHENIVKAYSTSPSMLGRGHTLLEPQGPVWSVGSSEWHPQLSVGSADGSCLTTNMLRSTRRSGSVPYFVHKIFQMDFKRKTGEYRMLDRTLPNATQDKPATIKSKSTTIKASKRDPSSKTTTAAQQGTGAWPQEVAVHKVTWNNGNGLSCCGLLASATSSGLCRVDNLWGRWMKDKVPYGGIQQIRREGLEDDAMDVDSDESVSD